LKILPGDNTGSNHSRTHRHLPSQSPQTLPRLRCSVYISLCWRFKDSFISRMCVTTHSRRTQFCCRNKGIIRQEMSNPPRD
jgi:hypothetical protein